MITLIRHAQVFAPQSLGIRDVLVADSRIAAIKPEMDLAGDGIEVIDAEGRWLLPGFVDPLTHPCGGGGEGGFGNRTAELEAADFITAGVTCPVGALGTDSIARSLEVLFGQVMKLRAHGVSAHMYSGSYRVPAATLTGDVARDLVMIEPVIGVGEIAIADHRSSQPEPQELRRLAAEVQLVGTLSGKGGTIFLHVGDGEDGLGLLERSLAGSDLARRLYYPTHCNRRAGLLEDAIVHAIRGGFIDFTVSTTPELVEAGEVPALDAHRAAIEAGAPAERLSFSSDAGGSLPRYVGGLLAGLPPGTGRFTFTNADGLSQETLERRWSPGSDRYDVRSTGLSWPREVYSMSHVSIPFPPDDVIYGASDELPPWGVPLGSIEPRGERRLLRIPMELFMRLRHNPFFPYIEQRLMDLASSDRDSGF